MFRYINGLFYILIDLEEYLLKTVYNSNIHVDRKIRISCLNVDSTGNNNYRYQDDYKNISRHISSNTKCYYTQDKKHGLLYKGRVDQKARAYDKIGSYCLTEYGWC